jgi:uncharacterized protein (DUF849 family)
VAVLITGGSGLIGTYVTKELLSRGEEIVIYDLKPPADMTETHFIQGPIADKKNLLAASKKHAVDRIIHLAALLQFGCEQRPQDAIEVNVLGTFNQMGIEFEVYDTAQIGNIMRLVEQGILDEREKLHFDFVMGIGGAIPPSPKSLLFLVEMLPPNCSWNVLGVGVHEFPMVTMGMIMGGNIRVGLEDNIFISKGVLAKSNAELVEKAVRIANELGREVATPEEARKILQLPS